MLTHLLSGGVLFDGIKGTITDDMLHFAGILCGRGFVYAKCSKKPGEQGVRGRKFSALSVAQDRKMLN